MSAETPVLSTDDPRAMAQELREQVRVLRRGWRLVALAVIACATLAVVYLARASRLYQATAQVLVLQQGGRPLSVGGADPMKVLNQDDLITTHALVIASPLVVGRALEAVPPARRPSLAGAADPVKAALERLKVTRPDRTAKILKLSYRAGSPEEAVRTVAAILESYQRFLADSYQKNNNEVVALITKARDELGRDIEALQGEYLKLYEGEQGFTVDESGRSFVSRRLEQWDREANDAMVKAIRLRSQLRLVRTLSDQGAGLFAVTQAVEHLGAGPVGLAAGAGSAQGLSSDYLRQLIQQQQELTEKYGPEYAKVRDLQSQIERVQRSARDTRGRLERAEVGELAGALEESLKLIEGLRDEYKSRFAQELGQAKEAEDARIKEATLRTNLERHQALFNSVVEQLKQAEFTSDFSTVTAETIEPPNAGAGPVSPRVTITLAMALAGGLALGCVAAVAVDRLDQRIRSPEELRRRLDVAVLGEVPRAAAVPGAPEFGRIAQARPRSAWAESYRAVRTNLDFLRRNRRLQVFLVTSPHPGDGKSSTASNLALSFAQAGRRVLLIDADLRKPAQHGIHALPPGPGLTGILAGHAPFAAAAVEAGDPGLWLLPAGPEVPNPAELLSAAAFAQLVEGLRESYDTILIDSPPLLAVADPAILAAVTDGTILVVRPNTLRLFEAGRVAELLAATGTPVLGAVVNAIDREHDRYGDGYGYGYGYGHGHGGGEVAEAPAGPAAGDRLGLGSRAIGKNGHANGNGAGHVLG
jgi:capsular exopolysaccharide synthesis family protein